MVWAHCLPKARCSPRPSVPVPWPGHRQKASPVEQKASQAPLMLYQTKACSASSQSSCCRNQEGSDRLCMESDWVSFPLLWFCDKPAVISVKIRGREGTVPGDANATGRRGSQCHRPSGGLGSTVIFRSEFRGARDTRAVGRQLRSQLHCPLRWASRSFVSPDCRLRHDVTPVLS